MRVRAVAVLLLMLAGCAQPLAVPDDGSPPGELFRPEGTGPFSAVVVLHGCGGVTPNAYVWARRLKDWGYAALVIDSFKPRGYPDGICTRAGLVPPELRARDAFAAAVWLRRQDFVAPERVGVIGFSHGGSTVMRAIQAPTVRAADAVPFRAAVAYYPTCPPNLSARATDVLVLIGDADDWTPARRCIDYAERRAGEIPAVAIKVYPGAYHAFDARGRERERILYGHKLVYDPAAAEDSYAMTRQFLDARLK